MPYRFNWRRLFPGLHWAWLAACLLSSPALADEQPFLRLDTALVEDDDERNFEFAARLSQTRAEPSADWTPGSNTTSRPCWRPSCSWAGLGQGAWRSWPRARTRARYSPGAG